MKCMWDVENLCTIARRLSQEKERIEKQIQQLERCKPLVTGSFRGEAGTEFLAHLQQDIVRMTELKNMIDVQVQKIRSVAKNCYEACEDTLRTKMNELESKMN